MTSSVAVSGASGYAGGEILRLLAAHPDIEITTVTAHSNAGDPLAVQLRRGLAYGVASAIRVIVLSTDVDAVVLGGGVTALGDRMLRPVLAELDTSAAASPFLRSLRLSERVDLLPPGSPAAALGAAILGAESEQEAVFHG